ncbi:hypothetical protein ACFX19_044495 [Malus domestica]
MESSDGAALQQSRRRSNPGLIGWQSEETGKNDGGLCGGWESGENDGGVVEEQWRKMLWETEREEIK